MKFSGNIFRILLFLTSVVFVLACQEKDKIFSEPYGEGKQGLGIRLDAAQVPVPAFGLPGSTVMLKASGLPAYKDDLIFRFNGEDAEIVEVTDEGVKVLVPTNASTGVLSLSIGDVVFFGPSYTVMGKVNLDPTFRAIKGANGTVTMMFTTQDDKRILIGGFTNYDNKGVVRPNNRIVRTFSDGTYDASFRSGKGANGFLESMVQVGDKYFIAGGFGGYDGKGHISNISRISLNGVLDTLPHSTWRRPDQTDTLKYFPAFNGGFNSSINKVYEHEGKLIVAGGFRYYITRIYDQSNARETRDSVILDSTEVLQLARLDTDGQLDKTYRFNTSTNMSLPGANGPIKTYMHKGGDSDGKMMIFGSFTSFDGQAKSYLLRLNPEGTIDNSFNPGGTGADFTVSQLTYNELLNKYLIVGTFKSYNGTKIGRIALLNEDGTLDSSFKPKEFEGGEPTFAKQLNDGLVVVSGYFKIYGGIARHGFMILDDTGSLKENYNATGRFSGILYDIVETQTEDERRALLIIGTFNQFNSLPEKNIIRVVLE